MKIEIDEINLFRIKEEYSNENRALELDCDFTVDDTHVVGGAWYITKDGAFVPVDPEDVGDSWSGPDDLIQRFLSAPPDEVKEWYANEVEEEVTACEDVLELAAKIQGDLNEQQDEPREDGLVSIQFLGDGLVRVGDGQVTELVEMESLGEELVDWIEAVYEDYDLDEVDDDLEELATV